MKWETKKLNDVIDYEQPTKYIVASTDYDYDFEIPVLTAGKSFLLGYTNEVNGIFENIPAIIFDDFTTAFHYVDFPFKVKSSAMKILKCDETKDDLKFLYYQMSRLKIDTQLHKRYWISKFSKLVFRRPPLKTQQRITSILDDAASLRDKTAQLLKEYDLLSQSIFLEMFGDPVINQKNWKKIPLTKTVVDKKYAIVDGPFGSSIKQSDYVNDGIPIIRINNIRNDGYYNSKYKYLTKKKYLELIRSKVNYNDILIVRVGNTIGKTCIFNQTFEALLSTTGVAKASIDTLRFNVVYIDKMMSIPTYKTYINTFIQGAGQPYLNLTKIKAFEVLDVPLELQNQFAEKINLIEQQKKLAKQELKESEDLFNCLLQKAFRGELVSE